MTLLRTAMLALAVVAILLPPRWCCALPGIQAKCCDACKLQAESCESCCPCDEPSESTKREPCKCLCDDQVAQLAKGQDTDHALPTAILYMLPALAPPTANSPCSLAAQAPPPHDLQATLCRWLI